MSRLAIIGSGIAGLGLAYYLRKHFELTIYEKDTRPGGHSHTVGVPENGKEIPIDTGFMVFNHVTYPNLLKLFNELEVPTKKTDMSFSVQHKPANIEYSGASFDRLFADRRNLFNLRFWSFLREIDRFNKEGSELGHDSEWSKLSLKQYAELRRYSADFVNLYLIPMTGALWSAPAEKVMQFPAISLLRFFRNHGLLGTNTHHQWWTVDGGSTVYVDRIVQQLGDKLKMNCAAVKVIRNRKTVGVIDAANNIEEYDQVVFACHADQALELISNPQQLEQDILGAFPYQRNDTILHSDASVMPRQERCWASWNYRHDRDGSSTHYWMNSLQNVSRHKNYFVTLNCSHLIDPNTAVKRMIYHHPVFDLNALQAQQKLPTLNRNSYREQLFFCGSYFGNGFHEDALSSALALVELLTGRAVCI